MMKNEMVVTSSSKDRGNFKYIPFVSASERIGVNTNNNNEYHQTNNYFLSGAEASQFYRDVVSAPSCSSSKALKCKSKSKNPNENENKFKDNNNPSSDNSRLTIFHHAQDGNVNGIKYCLSKSGCVDEQDMYGWTPLMCATFEGHYEAAEFLIKKGAKFDIKSRQGLTALDIATSKKNKALIKLFTIGVVNDNSSSVKQKRTETSYCDHCKCSYDESPDIHKRSIAHLLASNNNPDCSTFYHIPENNKGFQIMLKKGWDKNNGLGANATGRKFPIKTVLKTDRMCIGNQKNKPKVTHFGPNDYRSVKNSNRPTLNLKREHKLKKKAAKKLELKNRKLEIEFRRQFHGD